MSQKEGNRHFHLILCLVISFIMQIMFELKMLMGSLLENGQSTINTSPAHGKKKLHYIPIAGKFEVIVYNTCLLQQTSSLVIWFDCLKTVFFFNDRKCNVF